MEVRVIRQFLNGQQIVNEGQKLVVGERRGRDLERNKLVVPIEIGLAERQREAARQGVADPTDMDLAPPLAAETTAVLRSGGPTGAATPQSLSPPARRRGRPRLRPLEA